MNFLRIVKRAWNAIPLSDFDRWRVTSRLVELAIPFIKGGVIHNAYLREKEWQTKRIRPFSGDAFPAIPEQKTVDIIIFGVIDWRHRTQRPQHLALGFAHAGHRVFYISTTFTHSRTPGFELEKVGDDSCLYVVRLHLPGRPTVSAATPNPKELERLEQDLSELLMWTGGRQVISIVQHPYWYEVAQRVPLSRLIYDCLDQHDGFAHTGRDIALLEKALLKKSDAVVTTSQSLYEMASALNQNVLLVRNAVDFHHFSRRPDCVFQDESGRRILGYFGAIAEWLDISLIAHIASHFKDCLILLIGNDECGAKRRLCGYPNICFTGEIDYAKLPFYLHGMDVCLLPFRLTPLTLATNPLKIYEYLAAGKPVVSVALPELEQFDGLVATGKTHVDFVREITRALDQSNQSQTTQRLEFARQNTWQNRVTEFSKLFGFPSAFPPNV